MKQHALRYKNRLIKNPKLRPAIGKALRLYHQCTRDSIYAMRPHLIRIRQKGFDPQVVLDIGANRADWSTMAKSVFPRADFFLIEPQSELEEFLRSFVHKHTGSQYLLAGAGPEIGSMKLNVIDGYSASTVLTPENCQSVQVREVDVVTIDSLIQSGALAVPEMLKLDVQGYELEVLKGCSRCFGQSELFILEVALVGNDDMPLLDDVVAFMSERGYVVFDIFHMKPRLKGSGVLPQLDLAFVKRTSELRKSAS